MIKKIKLAGFKSYIDEDLSLYPLTILTGLNSSGKSSIIQAIRILDNAAHGEKNPLLDGYGDYGALNNPYVSSWGISVISDKEECIGYDSDGVYGEFKSFPNVIYVSAGRFGPKVSLTTHKDAELDELGENVLKCLDENQNLIVPEALRHPNAEGDTLLYNVRAWLSTISPDVKFRWEIQKTSDSSFSLFDEHRANNVGFGLSYTLPVIVALLLASTRDNSIVLLENPEAHLHPRGQVEIASLVAKTVQAGVQVVVETHSDHFYDGIRIAVKESDTRLCDQVVTYWFELDKQKNSQKEICMMDCNGRIATWPKGMFDQFEINAFKLM